MKHRLALDNESHLATLNEWSAIATPEDFLIVDLFAPNLNDEAEAVADEMYGYSANTKDRDPRYWGAVKRHRQVVTNKVLAWPGHRFGTAAMKKKYVQKGEQPKDAEMASQFGGMEIDGHNLTRNLFLTNIVMEMVRTGDWRMSTLKDVGRKQMSGQTVSDFALDFLVGVAGWSL